MSWIIKKPPCVCICLYVWTLYFNSACVCAFAFVCAYAVTIEINSDFQCIKKFATSSCNARSDFKMDCIRCKSGKWMAGYIVYSQQNQLCASNATAISITVLCAKYVRYPQYDRTIYNSLYTNMHNK